jgi:hypothetical protein
MIIQTKKKIMAEAIFRFELSQTKKEHTTKPKKAPLENEITIPEIHTQQVEIPKILLIF